MTAPGVADLESYLDSVVFCARWDCDEPADCQVRAHLMQTHGRRDRGCSTRTIMLCHHHTHVLCRDVRRRVPHRCACRLIWPLWYRDVILWVRGLQ